MKIVTQSFAFLVCTGALLAQAPTGAIAGVVRDPSGVAVSGVPVKLTSRDTAVVRTMLTSQHGDFSFPALLAGEYEVSVEAAGFQRTVRQAAVEAGVTTATDLNLRIGDVKESVTVEGASPQMHYDSNTVGGLVTQSQIQGLPLDGRSFLELAKLEPGVQPPTRANNNRAFVPVLGAPSTTKGQRVTVDGGSIVELSAKAAVPAPVGRTPGRPVLSSFAAAVLAESPRQKPERLGLVFRKYSLRALTCRYVCRAGNEVAANTEGARFLPVGRQMAYRELRIPRGVALYKPFSRVDNCLKRSADGRFEFRMP